MITLTRAFVREWAAVYDRRAKPGDRAVEREVKAYLRGQPSTKHLDKRHFVRLARWKSTRSTAAYQRNSAQLVRETTYHASRIANERLKAYILTALDGVSISVAAAILHFFNPRLYPVFDRRHRTTLKKAGWWPRRVDDDGLDAWEDYVAVMRKLSRRLRVSLRELDKALYAYDRWRKRRRR
jgi:hypothetical protein